MLITSLHYLGYQRFFLIGGDRIERRFAAKVSQEAVRKKPLAPTDNNLTSMLTPISFD